MVYAVRWKQVFTLSLLFLLVVVLPTSLAQDIDLDFVNGDVLPPQGILVPLEGAHAGPCIPVAPLEPPTNEVGAA